MKKLREIFERVKSPNKPVEGLPQKPIDIGNGEKYTPGPNQNIRNIAKSYMKSAGLPYNPPKTYKTVDPNRATKIANEYDKMKHDPNHPDVKASYKALADETMAQFHHITQHGIKISWMKPGHDPYEKTPHLGAVDLKKNNNLSVFKTDQGFGSSGQQHYLKDHPMMAKTGVHVNGHEMLVNDAFRAVHDIFGHHKEGFGFRANGEENAWRHHASMYSPLARGAMTSETRGQNSWVNYGPHGEKNRKANSSDTHYADQKVGLMPKYTQTEGLED